MLIFLSSCAEKQIEKLSSNDLNENFKPRVLENSSNTPLNTSINTKKTSDSKLISDEEETNRKRIIHC